MPMYWFEAWIDFNCHYPTAIKIAAGKINAVTGDHGAMAPRRAAGLHGGTRAALVGWVCRRGHRPVVGGASGAGQDGGRGHDRRGRAAAYRSWSIP